MKKVAIQGCEGSFHHMAVEVYAGRQTAILPCHTFRELVGEVQGGNDCDAGIMAIENSIAGSILPNYNLLQQSGLSVAGEVYLEVNQNLVVCKGVKLADITEVHSHPMAILQCLDYLDQYQWKLVETADTAMSAKHIKENDSRNIAVIASAMAAELFGLDVLAAGIQSAKRNYTRFLLLVRNNDHVTSETADKASVYFHIGNEKGSLAAVLQTIAAAGVNLSKLQSFPIPGSDWEYLFHADMEFESLSTFRKVISDITLITIHLGVYGIYKSGLHSNKI